MTTKTINLYGFTELSNKAKNRARDWWRESESQDFGSFGELNEPIETAAKLLGIELKRRDVRLVGGKTRSEPAIYWQLHVQGSGASFEGTYAYSKGCYRAIVAEFPKDTVLQRIALELSKLEFFGNELTATITTSGREFHMDVASFDAQVEPAPDTIADTMLELMRAFGDWIYGYIDAEYTYRMSDENVDYVLEANDYTFTSEGVREDS